MGATKKKAKPKPKAKMGRPRLTVDWDRVAFLAERGFTAVEVSYMMKLSDDLLLNRCKEEHGCTLSEFLKRNHGTMKLETRSTIIKHMRDGNITAAIYLDKRMSPELPVAKSDELDNITLDSET